MNVEVIKIKYNELLDYYQVTLRFTDPNYINPNTNPNDPEIHTRTYLTFNCNKKEDIEKQIERESYNVWLQTNSEFVDDTLTKKTFVLNDNTGELK